jgi:deoxyribonuclease-4
MRAQSHIPATRPPIGAHFSTAGGLHNALEEADRLACCVAQLFTTSPRQWQSRPLTNEAIALFVAAQHKTGVLAVSHAAYLINLAGVGDIAAKSREAFTDELRRCQSLEIPLLVVHPGSAGDQSEPDAIRNIARMLDETLTESGNTLTTILLETTAGMGRGIGSKFEQLAAILEQAACQARLGICLDTCHVFAAGYDLRTEDAYNATIATFQAALPLARLRLFHLNDSVTGFRSHVDRHAHLGDGQLGLAAFRFIMQDSRFKSIGKCLETEDDEKRTEDFDFLRRSLAVK